ncbi:hypothetical protein A33Q_1724 [Indibacter alkaliphilus LW1]|uniref:Uncharacterized protein n=1 Tax=Indibacter alkaliphilus (strain CCUG 57479 / KCTC 22604 / LW1) TaxID=1189612 RepID=S2E009_INDAL|nr:hypothetical protein A33Q_1724 [Indibacter alkaliphilus LW1]
MVCVLTDRNTSLVCIMLSVGTQNMALAFKSQTYVNSSLGYHRAGFQA